MSDYTLKVLKMRAKKYEDYVNCINPDYNRDEETAHEIITRFNEYENELKKYKQVVDKLKEYIETHKRPDEFLELNEWGTRDLLDILKEVE